MAVNKKLILGGVEVAKGSHITINLELPKLYNTPTQLPLHVIRGKKMDQLFLLVRLFMEMNLMVLKLYED